MEQKMCNAMCCNLVKKPKVNLSARGIFYDDEDKPMTCNILISILIMVVGGLIGFGIRETMVVYGWGEKK